MFSEIWCFYGDITFFNFLSQNGLGWRDLKLILFHPMSRDNFHYPIMLIIRDCLYFFPKIILNTLWFWEVEWKSRINAHVSPYWQGKADLLFSPRQWICLSQSFDTSFTGADNYFISRCWQTLSPSCEVATKQVFAAVMKQDMNFFSPEE